VSDQSSLTGTLSLKQRVWGRYEDGEANMLKLLALAITISYCLIGMGILGVEKP
jgi:hypothetical protein